jgi:hypothetical protein
MSTLNATQVIDPKTPREELMQIWRPRVRFQLPSDLQERGYKHWLHELLTEFVQWASPKNSEWHRITVQEENGREGGINDMHVGEDGRFLGSKLYAYDGTSRANVSNWKGVVFCDHMDKRSQVESIYTFSNHLERFLRHKGIPYERFGILVADGKDEVKQEVKE